MKKIAVLNCSHIINYGSVLQSYATEKVIKEITEQDVYSIRYVQNKDFVYLKNYLPLLASREIVSFKLKGVKKKLYLKLFNSDLKRKCAVRAEYFANFVKEHFNFSDVYVGREALNNAASDYSCVVLGSDQVWHPINFGSHYYTLEWVPENIPKITYAASFGVSDIPKNQRRGTAKYLSRIDSISVREKKGAEIVLDMIGKEVPVVVDPTFLLDASKWERICAPINESNYILCYFLGDNKKAREYAMNVKKKTGLTILCISFMDEVNKIDFNFGDKLLFEVGPAEFLTYIKNAKYVITDSFHGTVFSILFHKQFITFNRFEYSRGGSTNSRIDTLLEQVGLIERRYSEQCENVLEQEINYNSVDEIIIHLRDKSYKYLNDSVTNALNSSIL